MNFRQRILIAAFFGGPLLPGCDGAAPALDRAPRLAPAVSTSAPAGGPIETAPANHAAGLLPPRDSSGLIDVTFDDVKFEMEKTDDFERSMLTPKINAMVGQRIRIRGYMFPTALKRGITQFVLVRDNMECCFGPGAALFDCVLVTMQPGETAEFSIRPIAVEGAFRVEELPGPDGRPLAIYQMTGEAVN